MPLFLIISFYIVSERQFDKLCEVDTQPNNLIVIVLDRQVARLQ